LQFATIFGGKTNNNLHDYLDNMNKSPLKNLKIERERERIRQITYREVREIVSQVRNILKNISARPHNYLPLLLPRLLL